MDVARIEVGEDGRGFIVTYFVNGTPELVSVFRDRASAEACAKAMHEKLCAHGTLAS
jgi:hypothetical protein